VTVSTKYLAPLNGALAQLNPKRKDLLRRGPRNSWNPSSPGWRQAGPGVVAAYKDLKYVERDFRHIKSDDLDLWPIFHRLGERVRAHVLICMLACYLTCYLHRAWEPLLQLPWPARAPGDADPQSGPLRPAAATVTMLAEPTSAQRQAFELIGTPIPLTLK
jgi:hypothetical protein